MKTREQSAQQTRETFGSIPGFIDQSPDPQFVLDNERWLNFYFADTAISMREKFLISLAAGAAIGSPYATYFSSRSAQHAGWTEAQIYDAVNVARFDRYFSTWLHGKQWPLADFKHDTDNIISFVRVQAQQGQAAQPPRPENPTRWDILHEVKQTFGFVPQWIEQLPDTFLVNDWIELADWYFGETALDSRVKDLCSLAVSTVMQCPYCIYFDTEGLKQLDGVTQAEIDEAITVARMVQQSTTELTGTNYPLDRFKSETDQILKTMVEQMQKATAAA